ncbi:MAG TPA: hypothetical protein VHZ55_24245 [Bryobacteraceae bacterium]|nr:hypothetical protein [Bryobacteraceae bacterium]
MTIRSANRPGRVVLASVLSIAASFLASALYGADVEQTTPPAAATFGYVANTVDNTVSVIATASNTVVATIPVGQVPTG